MKQTVRIGCAFLLLTISAVGQTKIERAKTSFEQGKYDQVKAVLTSIDKGDPSFADARYYLGRVAYEEKEYEEAADLFNEAIETNDKVADYHHWLGNAYRNRALISNPFTGAMLAPKIRKAWEQAAALDAGNVDVRVSLVGYYTQRPALWAGAWIKQRK